MMVALAGTSGITQSNTTGIDNDLVGQREKTRAALIALTTEMEKSDDQIVNLREEIAQIKRDRSSVTAALIQAAKTEKKLSTDIADIEDRLVGQELQRTDILLSLHQRRETLSQVIGALQRVGLNPPPAILVAPEDALTSVRSAILLSAVVPEIRSETELLVDDLNHLASLTRSIRDERARLSQTMGAMAQQQLRLKLLVDEKQKLQQQTESELAQTQARAEELARKAGSLNELIANLERDIATAEQQRLAAIEEQKRLAKIEEEKRIASLNETAVATAHTEEQTGTPPIAVEPLKPQIEFASAKGQLVPPVAGRRLIGFGQNRKEGTANGQSIATEPGAIVTSPSDAIVLYAGPFRSYGQLVILDAGKDYHIVLSGMERITTQLGQRLLSGEPVGVMGATRLASAANFDVETSSPTLYVEFRHKGTPIDPQPWWTPR